MTLILLLMIFLLPKWAEILAVLESISRVSRSHNYYTLDNITGDKNSQGGYYIFGTDEYGDQVSACYWPDDGDWTLLDTGSIIDQFYWFYTDGTTVLNNSCYFQIDNSTGEWSYCYILNGVKTQSIASNQLKESVAEVNENKEMRAVQAEQMRVVEGEQENIEDSVKQRYMEIKKAIVDL